MNKKYLIGISISFTSIILSVLTRITDFFFLQSSFRYFFIIGSLSISIIFSFILYKFLENFEYQIKNLLYKYSLVKLVVAINFICALVIAAFIPKAGFPINHSLTIKTLPSENGTENIVQINRIRKLIDKPNKGSTYVMFDDLKIEGDNYQIKNEKLLIGDAITVKYDSFYSGCVSVFFNTSPDSHLVSVSFDQIEKRYSLNSDDGEETEVQLCAPISIEALNMKWKAIVISLYIIDFIAVFVLLSIIEILIVSLLEIRNDQTIAKILLIFFCIITLSASLDQIHQIIKYPYNRNAENLPPLRPFNLSNNINYGEIYMNTIHTKKFAHSFIMNFIDIYPHLENIYIDQITLNEYGFNSFEFERWFSVYNPQPIDNLPILISEKEMNNIIGSEDWKEVKFILNEGKKDFYIEYSKKNAVEYIVITNNENYFYLIPDTLFEDRISY